MFRCIEYASEHMEAFLYHKVEGKKGGNNVASLIRQSLKNNVVFEDAKEKDLVSILS